MLGQGHRASSTMSNPTGWGFLSLLPTAQGQPASPTGLADSKGENFWHLLMTTREDRKLHPNLKLTGINLSTRWMWSIDSQATLFYVWFCTAKLHKNVHTSASSRNSSVYNRNYICVPPWGINIQFTPVDWPLSRVIQRVGPPTPLREGGQEKNYGSLALKMGTDKLCWKNKWGKYKNSGHIFIYRAHFQVPENINKIAKRWCF